MSDRPKERRTPAYSLVVVHTAFMAGQFSVSGRVFSHLMRRAWRLDTVQECVAGLEPGTSTNPSTMRRVRLCGSISTSRCFAVSVYTSSSPRLRRVRAS